MEVLMRYIISTYSWNDMISVLFTTKELRKEFLYVARDQSLWKAKMNITSNVDLNWIAIYRFYDYGYYRNYILIESDRSD